MAKPVCAIIGVGPGNGAAFAQKFAKENYQLALLARSNDFVKTLSTELSDSKKYLLDVTDLSAIGDVFKNIEQEMGSVETLIYNVGAIARNNIETTSAEEFEYLWRVNCLGLMESTKCVIPTMLANKKGNIVVIGATASLKGSAMFSAFASSKFAQRGLAQSMARHLGPQGIHVSLLIIDGIIESDRARKIMPDKPESFFLQSDAIAETIYHVTQQVKSAWTFEVDVRPFGEAW